MNNLVEPQSAETKAYLENECGLRPYAPTKEPAYANPDRAECKFSSCDTNLLSHCRSHIQRRDLGSIFRRKNVCSPNRSSNYPLHFLHAPSACLLLLVSPSQGKEIQSWFWRAQVFRTKSGILSHHSSCLEPRSHHVRRCPTCSKLAMKAYKVGCRHI